MNGRADVVRGSVTSPKSDPELSSGIGPAPIMTVNSLTRGSHLELGAMPGAVPSARLHARLVITEWGLAKLADTVELVVSELVTNAVHASEDLAGSRFKGRWSPGPPPVRLWLQTDHTRVLVQVWDGSDRMPQLREPDLAAENGRGLFLVTTLSARYGSYPLEGSSGKVVWAEVGVQ